MPNNLDAGEERRSPVSNLDPVESSHPAPPVLAAIFGPDLTNDSANYSVDPLPASYVSSMSCSTSASPIPAFREGTVQAADLGPVQAPYSTSVQPVGLNPSPVPQSTDTVSNM